MRKFLDVMMSLMILFGGICVSSTPVFASESDDYVNYRIYMPVDCAKVDVGTINNITLHYGVDGWNNVQDVTLNSHVVDYYMGITFKTFETTIRVKKGTKVDYCFKQEFTNNTTVWDNNNNNDYHIVVSESNIK
ncbi:hypothetical protein JNUCC42_03270 [Brevibacterium sp. JNUCC-42]|nr:hypothetical protein JNUCC42_03270 [Brevibacterium sp. JNUCC-42]